jgi:hypothetical protein
MVGGEQDQAVVPGGVDAVKKFRSDTDFPLFEDFIRGIMVEEQPALMEVADNFAVKPDDFIRFFFQRKTEISTSLICND